MGQLALWYYRYGGTYYELCESEEEAAGFAYGMSDAGSGSVIGVQFPDGRIIAREDWTFYKGYEEKMWASKEELYSSYVSPPMREVRNPFHTVYTVSIEADSPSWIGIPVEGGE